VSPAELLHALHQHGAELRVRNDRLQVRGAANVPAELRTALSEHKPTLLQLLSPGTPGEDLEHQRWDASLARTLVAALYRRVGSAWNALPIAHRPDRKLLLGEAERGLWAAYEARDLPGVRRAVARYEKAAAPVLQAWRANRAMSAWEPRLPTTEKLVYDEAIWNGEPEPRASTAIDGTPRGMPDQRRHGLAQGASK
jgi:hypothetical protein